MNFEKIKNIITKFVPSIGGTFLFFVLFLYGLINNLSISYMGNTSKQLEEYIIGNFLGHIILFLLKILFSYLVIGLAIGIIVNIFIISICYLFKKELSFKNSIIINFVFTGFIFLLSFFKDIILYPQVFMNNFYVKNSLNKFIFEFLTDNINPQVFTAIQVAVILIIALSALSALYKSRKNIFKNIVYIIISAIICINAFNIIFVTNPVKKDKPNVLILASDALRLDHFSWYGYPRKTTPNIDRLISEGISFMNAYIEVPRTFPSWVSILTGRFSATHGIRHMFPTSRDLNRDFKTIAGELKQKGYETSVIADYAGDVFSRISLGFDKVEAPYFNIESLIDQVLIEAHTFLLSFLTNKTGLELFPVLKDSAYFCPPEFVKDKIIQTIRESKKPFFITTFFSSTHFPYASQYPYYKLFADKNYTGPYKYFKQQILSSEKNSTLEISAKDVKQIHSLYDGGLKAFDDAVGKVMNYLSDNGILDNTMIVLLSDHGENLYEGQLGMGHGEHFRGHYAIRIPFIIRLPGLNAKKNIINETVRHVDIAPTILSALNYPVPNYMEGVSLMPLINGRELNLFAFGETGIWFDNSLREDLFFQKLRIMYPDITQLSEVDMNFDKQIVLNDNYRDIINLAKHRYVFDGRYKLIYMPLKDKVLYELYDTVRDPDEVNNIVYIDKENFSRLRKILFEWIGRNNDVIIRKDYVFPVLRY
jgi:arylsulfatase A-like enzyme